MCENNHGRNYHTSHCPVLCDFIPWRANHFFNFRASATKTTTCFACSEAFVADSARGKVYEKMCSEIVMNFLLPWFDFRDQRKLDFSETTQSDDGDDNHLIVLFHLQHADPGARPGQLKKLQFVWGSHKRVFLVGNELPGLKTQAQHIAALPVLLPQPLCHPFDHPVKDMKAGTLKMASAQVFISEQSYINIWGTRRLIIGCFVDHSGQRIHHSRHHCQEPGGVKD